MLGWEGWESSWGTSAHSLVTWEGDTREPSEQVPPDCPFLPHSSEYSLPSQSCLRLLAMHPTGTNFAQGAFGSHTLRIVFRASFQHTHTHTQNKIKQSVISREIHPAGLFYFGAKIVLSKLTTDNRAVQVSLTSRFYAPPVLGSQSSIGQSLCP